MYTINGEKAQQMKWKKRSKIQNEEVKSIGSGSLKARID